MPGGRGRRGAGRAEFILLLCSVLLALLAAEGIARLAGAAPVVYQIQPGREKTSYRISDNPILGYELKENYRDIRPDYWESFARTNQYGLRDIDRKLAKPPGKKRVLLLGDSVALGIGLTDLNFTISRQFEQLYGDEFEMLNFGLAGYNTLQEVELLRAKGLQFSPDLVVLLFTANDFDDKSGNIWAYSFNRPPGVNALFIWSHLFRWLALKFDLFHFRSELDPNYQQDWNYKAIGSNNVEKGLRELAELSRKHGFKVLIAAWPEMLESGASYPGFLFSDRNSGKLRIEEIAGALSIPVVRLDDPLRQQFESSREEKPEWSNIRTAFATDGMHPTSAGAHAAARALRQVISEAGLTQADS